MSDPTPEQPDEIAELTFDPAALMGIVNVGLARSAAFLGVGLIPTAGEPPTSVRLKGFIPLGLLPDPLPEDFRATLLPNYTAWLTGAVLREIEQHFNVFLDHAAEVVGWTQVAGTLVDSGFKPKVNTTDTNSGGKLERLEDRLGLDHPFVPYFASLSFARNCLTHGLGIVRERDAGGAEALTLRWPALEMRIVQEEGSVTLTQDMEWAQAVDPSKPARAVVHYVERTIVTPVGQQLIIAPHDVNEMIFTYHRAAFRLVEAIKAVVAAKADQPPGC